MSPDRYQERKKSGGPDWSPEGLVCRYEPASRDYRLLLNLMLNGRNSLTYLGPGTAWDLSKGTLDLDWDTTARIV